MPAAREVIMNVPVISDLANLLSDKNEQGQTLFYCRRGAYVAQTKQQERRFRQLNLSFSTGMVLSFLVSMRLNYLGGMALLWTVFFMYLKVSQRLGSDMQVVTIRRASLKEQVRRTAKAIGWPTIILFMLVGFIFGAALTVIVFRHDFTVPYYYLLPIIFWWSGIHFAILAAFKLRG